MQEKRPVFSPFPTARKLLFPTQETHYEFSFPYLFSPDFVL